MRIYRVKIQRSGAIWTAQFPDLPETFVSAETKNDAHQAAARCLLETMMARAKAGVPLPRPTPMQHGDYGVTVEHPAPQ